ncbi:MAG: hypothetical protein NC405_05640 [Odoribacter sp.]|nr:hypothetical protein [Odoribacter sp.]
MNKPRIIAVASTTLIAIAAVILMLVTHLSVQLSGQEWPPKRQNEVALVEEENIFDILPAPRAVNRAYEESSPAHNEVPADNLSTPEPTTGMDIRDNGTPADPPPPVTSAQPSPVKKHMTEQPQKTGPSQKELQQRAEATRRATSATENAFKNARGNNNVANQGNTQGNSGSPAGTNRSYHGTGSGNATGGWKVPRYQRIPATTTGEIKVKVSINPDGSPGEITFLTGKAPAGTDPTLRQAVAQEIKQRRFTRGDGTTGDRATAVITYIFK